MVELTSKGPQWAVGECGAKPTSNVEPTTEVFPEHVEHFFRNGKWVFQTRRQEVGMIHGKEK